MNKRTRPNPHCKTLVKHPTANYKQLTALNTIQLKIIKHQNQILITLTQNKYKNINFYYLLQF